MTCALLILLMLNPAMEGTPEAKAEEYFKYTKELNWDGLAGLFHQSELDRFKGMFVEIFEALESSEESKAALPQMEQAFGISSSASLKAQTSKAFFSSFFARIMGNAGDVKFDKLEVLGHVREGEKAHVVTRMTIGMGEFSMSQMEIISMSQVDGKWGVILSGKMEGIANTIKGQMGL